MKKLYSVCLVALLLASCGGHIYGLVPEDSDHGITTGTFQREGSKPTMALEYAGMRYDAEGFAINRTQNYEKLRKTYGSGKHYNQIVSGLDKDHYVYSATPELRSPDGAILRCSMEWRAGVSVLGVCVTENKRRINFRLK